MDDASIRGTICFDNKALYERSSSTHKSIDVKNLNALDKQKVLMPLYFLIGNGFAESGDDPEGIFIRKLIYLSNSSIARDMVKAAIRDKDNDDALHRLGVTMHVYVDTWAYQGFAGVMDIAEAGTFDVFKDGFINLINQSILELGHGQTFVFPDTPFLSWKYVSGHNEKISRTNLNDFCQAVDALCKGIKKYRLKNPDAEVTGIGKNDIVRIRWLFEENKFEAGEDRHEE